MSVNLTVIYERFCDIMAKKKKVQQEGKPIPLKELREAAGLNQLDMAYHLGVAESTYRRWEKTGNPALTYEQWVKLCSLFGRSFDRLPEPVVQAGTQAI